MQKKKELFTNFYCIPLINFMLSHLILTTTNEMCLTMSSSVQFSCSVMSDSLWPHEPQNARPPCPSPTPRVYPNSCPLSRWHHLTILSSVVPFYSCLRSFPASGSFQMSQLVASGGQSIGVSASASVLPMNTKDWSPLEWTGWLGSPVIPFIKWKKSSTKEFSSVSGIAWVWSLAVWP